MEEDKREKVRLGIDGLFYTRGPFNLARKTFTTPFIEELETRRLRENEMEIARKRAKLSVLNLTERDKRFLKEMKIAV